jgi:hypothetical protein
MLLPPDQQRFPLELLRTGWRALSTVADLHGQLPDWRHDTNLGVRFFGVVSRYTIDMGARRASRIRTRS